MPKTDWLTRIVEMQGGWQPGDGSTFGVYDCMGNEDSCIWAMSWQFPQTEYPGVMSVTADDMQPIDNMNETEVLAEISCCLHRFVHYKMPVELGWISEFLLAAVRGREWIPDAKAFLRKARVGYPSYSSKQASFATGCIRAGGHPFYKV